MALPNGFLERLDNPVVEVDRSVFLDRNGYWAKDWPDVVEVFVLFSDAVSYRITPTEFRALTRAQKKKIREAPSSPLP